MRILRALVIALAFVALAPPVPTFDCRIGSDGSIIAKPGVVCTVGFSDVSAQGAMSKATAKLLVSDLIEAGYAPTIRQVTPDTFTVTVLVDDSSAATPPTAAQVNAFANSRSVVARVLMVQFQ